MLPFLFEPTVSLGAPAPMQGLLCTRVTRWCEKEALCCKRQSPSVQVSGFLVFKKKKCTLQKCSPKSPCLVAGGSACVWFGFEIFGIVF